MNATEAEILLIEPRLKGAWVVDSSGCWLWQRKKVTSSGDYGVLRRGGHDLRAHRYLWTLANGPIPDGLTVDHLCFETSCVNPSHLRVIPHSINATLTRRFVENVCYRGHAFTPENTAPAGKWRRCVTCYRARTQKRQAANTT